jgi:hypothetical protein
MPDVPLFPVHRQADLQELYCLGKFAECERRKLRHSKQPVPANLLPNGCKLWRDEDKPPPMWE